jgi:hypothetical protein
VPHRATAPAIAAARIAWGLRREKPPLDESAKCANITGTSHLELQYMDREMHSTNYTNTVILPSPDCKSSEAAIPNKHGSIAQMQFDRVQHAPYTLTSDEVITQVVAARKDIPEDELDLFRAEYFSKGQACLRASPLVKTFGWAVHHNADARIALIDPASPEFAELTQDANIKQVNGMRNKRA